MRKYMRFTEDKTRFINQLPWKSEEEKQKKDWIVLALQMLKGCFLDVSHLYL